MGPGRKIGCGGSFDKIEQRGELDVLQCAGNRGPRPAVIDAITTAMRWLLALTRAAAGIFLIASIALNFVNIVGRYFFSVSVPWAEEIMLFLMVGCVFTGCCAVAWDGRQIRMDVVLMMLPPKVRDFFNVLAQLVLIATAVAVAVFAWPVITQLAAFDERSQAAYFPLVIPQAMIPIGYTLMALLVAVRLFLNWHGGAGSGGSASGPHS
jgi:TRAP-type C4-dicarboxylate transport system permease small subunit